MRHPTQAFLGEFPWAPAVTTQAGAYHSRPGWTTGDDRDRLPHAVAPTYDQYFWENSGYDCSIDDTIAITLPGDLLIEGLGLRWQGSEGAFVDESGTVVAFDPSVQTSGPGALVVARDRLMEFLKRERLALVWVLIGERQLIGRGREGLNYNELSGIYTLIGGKIVGKLSSYSPSAYHPATR